MDRRKRFSAWGVWGLIILSLILLMPEETRAMVVNQDTLTAFSFSSPGARANGMGGAFIGVADDATAAYTNPAGLTVLTKPEVAAEYKYSNRKYYTRAEGFSDPINRYGLVTAEYEFSDNATTGLSFLSFSYPFQRGNITLFRHELLNIESNMTRYTQYPPPDPVVFRPYQNTHQEKTIDTYGVAFAYKVLDRFSLGGSVGFNQYKDQTQSTNINIISTAGALVSTADSSGDAMNFNVGFLWNPFGGLNIGGVYRYGPKFDYTYQFNRFNYITQNDSFTYFIRDSYKVPDVFGLGISYRTTFGLTMSADLDYVRYSQMMTDVQSATGLAYDAALGSYSTYKMDDAYEIHTGVEWAFTVKDIPMALRAGYAFKQAHGMYKDPDPSLSAGANAAWAYQWQKGDDENIFSAGFGIVLFKNLQLDFSGAWGNLSTEYIGSFVIRF